MTTNVPTSSKAATILRNGLVLFREQSGLPFSLWILLALLNSASLLVLRHELAPGEFGTLNTVLGVIGLAIFPLLALYQILAWYTAGDHAPDQLERVEALREASPTITQILALTWGAASLVLVFVGLQLIGLPRYPLDLFTALNVLVALGALMSAFICRQQNLMRRWGWLLFFSATARLLIGAGLAWEEPWTESGLAALLIAGFIILGPALSQAEIKVETCLKDLRTAWNRDFLLYFGAAFSALLSIFLFSSADRIVAQSWFGQATNNNFGMVDWAAFDGYQSAGLIARSLLWGTQPLLLVLFAQRSRLTRSTSASLTWFWIYLGTLVTGIVILVAAHQPLSWLFCGNDFSSTASFLPTFALAMFPLGLLQALAIFSIASRRYPECFVLGVCGIAYAVMLFLVGRRPEIMPAYMFGGGLVILMIVLFVGVVRWGRKQP